MWEITCLAFCFIGIPSMVLGYAILEKRGCKCEQANRRSQFNTRRL